MKRIIQLILLSIIIITSLIFYKVYFVENTKNQKQVVNLDSNSIEQTENNLIKKDGVLIIEHDKDTEFEGENLEVRKYGTVHFSIFSF